ncbi:MAG: type I-G CRISPR-associated protein Csb2 [Pirellulales bacterium]
MTHLLLTVRWLDDRYHGLLDRQGPPEWPPSPFRLFQALVAGVARGGKLDSTLGESLAWLESLRPPMILAPRSHPGQVVTSFVPNNDGDKRPNRQDRLTAKTARPTIMLEPPEVHYLWVIRDEDTENVRLLRQAARCLTTLGWGVDLAYADARVIDEGELGQLRGVRWRPRFEVRRDHGTLRVPMGGSLDDLREVHQSRLDRIEHGKPLNTVDKPKVFDRVFYESQERPLPRPCVLFELRNDDGTRFSYPQAKLVHVAGMVRHLAIEVMKKCPPDGVPDDWVLSYVAGHRDAGVEAHRQFSYVPLPSIGHAHTDPSVRRVMITAPPGDDRLLRHLAMLLGGAQLRACLQIRYSRVPGGVTLVVSS